MYMSPLLKKSLFWDTNPETIDLQKNKRYVIERILRFGNFEEYRWLKDTYSPEDIRLVIERERSQLDRKSLNFWSQMYQIDNSHAPGNTQ